VSRTRNTKTYLKVQTAPPIPDDTKIPIIPTTITNQAITIQSVKQQHLISTINSTIHYQFWRVATNHVATTDIITYVSYLADVQNDTIDISAIIESNQGTIYIQCQTPEQYQPTVLTANAFSCLCVLTHLANYRTDSTKIQLTVPNITTKKHLLKSRFAINSPKSTYSTEWDTFKEASHLLNTLGNQHVTILVATSNTYYKELKEQFNSSTKPIYPSQASIDINQPYLKIDNKRVATGYQQAIRDQSTAH
jgi:hypothetical protein